MEKRLYIVCDFPGAGYDDYSNECYVVRAKSERQAIETVNRKTGHYWDREARLVDNMEVWE